jgi:hypothetical protein
MDCENIQTFIASRLSFLLPLIAEFGFTFQCEFIMRKDKSEKRLRMRMSMTKAFIKINFRALTHAAVIYGSK